MSLPVRPHDPRSRPARGTGEILVTGATGQLGRAVCPALVARAIPFRALVRPGSRSKAPSGTRVWSVEGDLLDPDSLPAALEGVRVVLHLAGLVRDPDPTRNDAVHVGGTRALLIAARAAGVTRIVVISSDTVARGRQNAYTKSKVAMERVLAEEARGIEIVVLRPSMMIGPSSPHLRSLRRVARLPFFALPPGLGTRAPVLVDDVARAVITAMDLPSHDLPDVPIPLFGPEDLDFAAIVAAITRSEGRRPPTVLPLPRGSLAAIAAFAHRLGSHGLADRLLGMEEDLPRDREIAKRWLAFEPRSIVGR